MERIKNFLKGFKSGYFKVKNYFKFKPTNLIIVVLIAVTLGALISTFYFYNQFTVLKENPQKVVQEETEKLVSLVSRLIILPKNETPTIATVLDPEKLKDQPFFANAKKGDKVLIYTNAKKAILYDPAGNKIIEVAPLNIGE